MPLQTAAKHGHASCVKLLLEKGAHADVMDSVCVWLFFLIVVYFWIEWMDSFANSSSLWTCGLCASLDRQDWPRRFHP